MRNLHIQQLNCLRLTLIWSRINGHLVGASRLFVVVTDSPHGGGDQPLELAVL